MLDGNIGFLKGVQHDKLPTCTILVIYMIMYEKKLYFLACLGCEWLDDFMEYIPSFGLPNAMLEYMECLGCVGAD